eukprot:scaffold89146_cov32-Tisochrysis_lutea.AAC.4
MSSNCSGESGRGHTKPRVPSRLPASVRPPRSNPTKFTTYCIPVTNVCSSRLIRMCSKMYDGITDASRTLDSPSRMGTKMRSISVSSRCTLIAWRSVRSTVPSNPLAVCSRYQCGSVSRWTSDSDDGNPCAILRRTLVRRSTRSDFRPVILWPKLRSSVLSSATVMLAIVGSDSLAFSISASLAIAVGLVSSSSSSSSTAEKSMSNEARGATAERAPTAPGASTPAPRGLSQSARTDSQTDNIAQLDAGDDSTFLPKPPLLPVKMTAPHIRGECLSVCLAQPIFHLGPSDCE